MAGTRTQDGFWCKEHDKEQIAAKLADCGYEGLRIKLDFFAAWDEVT